MTFGGCRRRRIGLQAQTFHGAIPRIAHQRLAPVSAPPMFSPHRMSALYAEALEPIVIQVVPRYNPAAYMEDSFTTTMQVSLFFANEQTITNPPLIQQTKGKSENS